MSEYVDKLEKQMDRALDRITELEAVKKKSSDEVAYWAKQVSEWAAKCGVSDAELEALRAENARLREALKPFAEAAEEYGISVPSHYPADEYTFQVGDLRKARKAMGESDGR